MGTVQLRLTRKFTDSAKMMSLIPEQMELLLTTKGCNLMENAQSMDLEVTSLTSTFCSLM